MLRIVCAPKTAPPYPVGRNMWTADAPLKAVMELMAECVPVFVVIAFERGFFPRVLSVVGTLKL